MKNLMIDIETLGNKSGCVITSIAAVEFDIVTGECFREFYETVSIDSCLKSGLFVQEDTIKWWFSQDKEAQERMFTDTRHIREVLRELREFMNDIGTKNLQVWGNSNRFDLGILAQAYYSIGDKEIPWKYSLERDVRTLVMFAPKIKAGEPFIGIKHDPIADCKHQISYCTKIYNQIIFPSKHENLGLIPNIEKHMTFENKEVEYQNLEIVDPLGNVVVEGSFNESESKPNFDNPNSSIKPIYEDVKVKVDYIPMFSMPMSDWNDDVTCSFIDKLNEIISTIYKVGPKYINLTKKFIAIEFASDDFVNIITSNEPIIATFNNDVFFPELFLDIVITKNKDFKSVSELITLMNYEKLQFENYIKSTSESIEIAQEQLKRCKDLFSYINERDLNIRLQRAKFSDLVK